MTGLFLKILQCTFHGSIVILAVVLLRLLLKKAPRSAFCLLWMLALLRLALPFEIESSLSLQPESPAVIGYMAVQTIPETEEYPRQREEILNDQVEVPPVTQNASAPEPVPETPRKQTLAVDWASVFAWIWLGGVGLMLALTVIRYGKLKHRVREAWPGDDGCWECAGLDTAFVLGFREPRIYLPAGLEDTQRQFIREHENTHIARNDHWYKLFGYLVLTLHWFNPLVWLAYSLLCRDIELACDEHVVRHMDTAQRKAYSAALLSCSSRHVCLAAAPVAFGETSVKQRILNVLHYRRPGFWITLTAAAAIGFVAVCLMTSPAAREPDLSFLNYRNAAALLTERKTVIALNYHSGGASGNLGVRKASAGEVAAYLDGENWSDYLVSESHGSFTAYIDVGIDADYSIRVFDNGHADVTYGGETRHYRTGKNAYPALKALLTEATGEDVVQAQAEYVLNWGISLKARNVTSSGMELVCVQDGTPLPGMLMTGRHFVLEKKTRDGWEALPIIQPEAVWTTEGLMISMDGVTSWDVDWTWLYGTLPEGEYRIGKSISHSQITGESVDYTYYAEFAVTEHQDSLARIRAVLEAVQQWEHYSILELRSFGGTEKIHDAVQMQWLRYGDDRVRVTETTTQAPVVSGCMGLGNDFYLGTMQDTGWVWAEAAAEEAGIGDPWLYTFDLEEQRVEVLSREETDDGYSLRLMVYGSCNMGSLVAESYYVDFQFNHAGEFLRAIQHVQANGELDGRQASESMVCQMIVSPLTGADCLATIRDLAGQLQSDVPPDSGALCTDENCTDPEHRHSGTRLRPMTDTVCQEPGCTDPGHSHDSDCSDETCTDTSHSHHHDH